MEQKKIDRINYLSRKSKSQALSSQELSEQKLLREEYIAAFRQNLTQQLDNTYIVDEDGQKRKLQKRTAANDTL